LELVCDAGEGEMRWFSAYECGDFLFWLLR
jgi:hypothetical protein